MKSIARISGLLLLLLVGISIGCAPYKTPATAPKEPNHVSLDPTDWYFFNATNMPVSPAADADNDAAFTFDFTKTGIVRYLQTPFQATYPPQRISMTFKVIGHDPHYVVVDPADHAPATVRIFFEQQNDDLRNPDGRWWANGVVYNLGSPTDDDVKTFIVDFNPANWSNVYGQNGTTRIAQFNAALANIGWVGCSFGGQDFAGHGVSLGSGTSKFEMIGFYVN